VCEEYGVSDEIHFINEKNTIYKTDLRVRLFRFAVDAIRLLKLLPYKQEYSVFRYQLSKSATSIGANYEEAQGASSRKDFKNKINIALKEARETNYFLRIIQELKIIDAENISKMVNESEEITKILNSIITKLRENYTDS